MCALELVFGPIRRSEQFENPAPTGRTSLAQRFSAGKNGSLDSSPGGTTLELVS